MENAEAPHRARRRCREVDLARLQTNLRTLMSRLGVREDIAELSIGHVRGGLIGIYDHDPKWSERVDAFAKVSAHIERLISQGVRKYLRLDFAAQALDPLPVPIRALRIMHIGSRG